jgi:hypothetical protein
MENIISARRFPHLKEGGESFCSSITALSAWTVPKATTANLLPIFAPAPRKNLI